MTVDKLSADNSMVGANEARNKINEIIDDASGDFSAAAVTVADEGGDLSTAATKLDFVGAGVVASGTGATKTITISGGGGGGGGGTVGKFSTGWNNTHGGVTVANGSTHTITHNLGTADVQVMVYVNSSASDTNAQEVGMMVHNSAGQFDCGCLVTSLATNSLVLQLGEDGYNDIGSGGGLSTTAFTSKYIKVIVLAGSPPGGAGGGFSIDYFSTPSTLFSISSVSSDGNNGSYVTYNMPVAVPTTAKGVVIRFRCTADESIVQILAKHSTWSEREVAIAYGLNNSDDAASDNNTFIIPYNSTIDIKFENTGVDPGDAEETAGAYIDGYISSEGGKYSTGWNTVHGGVTVADGSTHTIDHNLGSADGIVQIWVNSSASDSGAQVVGGDGQGTGGGSGRGAVPTSISTTQATIQLLAGGYLDFNSSGVASVVSFASKYIKIVVIS